MPKKLFISFVLTFFTSMTLYAQGKEIDLRHSSGSSVQVIVDEAEWQGLNQQEQEQLTSSYQLELTLCDKTNLTPAKDGDRFDFRYEKISAEQKAMRWIIRGNNIDDINEMIKLFPKEKAFILFAECLKKKQRKITGIIKNCFKTEAEKVSAIEANIEKITSSCENGRLKPYQSDTPPVTVPAPMIDADNTTTPGTFSIHHNLTKFEIGIHELLLEQNDNYKALIADMENGMEPDAINRKHGEHFMYYSNNGLNTSDVYKFRSKGGILSGKKSGTNPRVYFFYDKDTKGWTLVHTQYKHYVGSEKPKEVKQLHNILNYRIRNYLASKADLLSRQTPASDPEVPVEVRKNGRLSQQARWDRIYELVRIYVESNNDIPTRYVTTLDNNNKEVKIGDWIKTQLLAYNKGVLPKDRAEKLERLEGWTWTPYETSWNENYELLKLYIAGYRELPSRRTTVKGKNGETINLGNWTFTQKTSYKRGTLSADRIEKLEALSVWTWKDNEAGQNYDKTFTNKQLEGLMALAEKLNIQISDRVIAKIGNINELTPEMWTQLYNLMVDEYDNNDHAVLSKGLTELMYSEAEMPREIWEVALALLGSQKLDEASKKALLASIFSPFNTTIPEEVAVTVSTNKTLLDKDLVLNWEGTIKDLEALPSIAERSNFVKSRNGQPLTITEENAINLLNQYLPIEKRSQNFEAGIRELILHIVNDDNCSVGEEERRLLFDNGLLNYLASTGNKSAVFMLGSLSAASELNDSSNIMLDISSSMISTDGVLNIGKLEFELDIKLPPLAIEKINKGVDAILIRK